MYEPFIPGEESQVAEEDGAMVEGNSIRKMAWGKCSFSSHAVKSGSDRTVSQSVSQSVSHAWEERIINSIFINLPGFFLIMQTGESVQTLVPSPKHQSPVIQ